MIQFTIPMPPSTNGLFINAGKRRVRSPEYRAWALKAGWAIKEQKIRPLEPGHGDLDIDILIGPRDPRSDIDNRCKAGIDLCVSMGLIQDDKYIKRLSIAWGDIQGCRMTIERAA